MKSLGLLGGTFDPIHHGHLHLAQSALEQLKLQRVLLIPAGQPWQRIPVANSQQRLAMARLAVTGHPRLGVDDCEVLRSGPTYTVDTLRELRLRLGSETVLWLVVGADAMGGLHSWHQWPQLFEYAHLAVANRPGFAWHPNLISDAALREFLLPRFVEPQQVTGAAGALCALTITPLEISSTQIRKALRQGQSIADQVPEEVVHYIQQHRLYRPEEPA
jgi:nicotinate-nucleotide adenylyltransferase